MMNIFPIVSTNDKILGVVVSLLPLFFVITLCLWVFRLIRTLRDRLDSIEDKLELLVLAQDINLSKAKAAHEAVDQESPSKTQ
jgi:hypothetical protein